VYRKMTNETGRLRVLWKIIIFLFFIWSMFNHIFGALHQSDCASHVRSLSVSDQWRVLQQGHFDFRLELKQGALESRPCITRSVGSIVKCCICNISRCDWLC
jgi:hypothetical protein